MDEDVRMAQENILLQLQMILNTTESINETICKTIDLVDGHEAPKDLHTVVTQGYISLRKVLELLGQLSQQSDTSQQERSAIESEGSFGENGDGPVLENGQVVYPSNS